MVAPGISDLSAVVTAPVLLFVVTVRSAFRDQVPVIEADGDGSGVEVFEQLASPTRAARKRGRIFFMPESYGKSICTNVLIQHLFSAPQIGHCPIPEHPFYF